MDPGKAAARRTARWLGGGVALMVVGTFVAFLLARSCTPAPPPKLVISKETTWFTGPLRPDGGIDWVAALEAEARAEGLKDEENGAPLMKEAVKAFLNAREWIEKSGRVPPPAPDSTSDASPDESLGAITRAMKATARGDLGAPNVEAVLAWLDHCAPALENARLAMERPRWFLITRHRMLSSFPTFEELPLFALLLQALRLRIATRTARGDLDGALADAATACAAARVTGAPATLFEQSGAVAREAEVLEQLLRCVRATPALPAERAWEEATRRPSRWSGDAALREAIRAERLVLTSSIDAERRIAQPANRNFPAEERRAVDALQRIDLNPHFRRLQRTFDDLERRLLDGDRPARDRVDAALAALRELEDAGESAAPRNRHALTFLPSSDEDLVTRYFDRRLASFARFTVRGLHDWLAHLRRRDALLAELAFLAGAPERRDSWLGEPLVVTRKADGSIEVGGGLIELARERGSKLELEQWR